jgi:gamma-glutamylcyclotransferase (GGCT)/AIG2-like uncharacterized protein YtfP
MEGQPAALFVYGTLKRGQLNSSLLTPYARSTERGWISGRLFDVGLFPALTEGEGQVYGELVRLDAENLAEVLAVIDALEEYREDDPDRSTYLRRMVEVTTERGDTAPAYAYFYNVAHVGIPCVDSFPPVESGEWHGPSMGTGPALEGALDVFEQHVRTFRVSAPTRSRNEKE